MRRDRRTRGIFVGFAFSRDAVKEIRCAEIEEKLGTEVITVDQIVEQKFDQQLK